MKKEIKRCAWVKGKPDYYIAYHDQVWGRPVHDDQALFKWLSLEIFHIGLSWQLVLSKYKAFMEAFNDFDYKKVAQYDGEKIETLMTNKAIIRYRKKIEAVVHNAKEIQSIQQEFSSFDAYIWSFTKGQIIINQEKDKLTHSELSEHVTKDLKKRGFQFIGSVTIHSYLQAIGIINAHDYDCAFRINERGVK